MEANLGRGKYFRMKFRKWENLEKNESRLQFPKLPFRRYRDFEVGTAVAVVHTLAS